MKTHIIRLESVVPNGLGGPEASCIDLIYSFLLQEYQLDLYSYIHINQIGEDLNELVLKQGNQIYINIRYPVDKNFNSRNLQEKNRLRLDCIHTALLRIAESDKKLDIHKLELIKLRIIENNFRFDIIYKIFKAKKSSTFISKIIIVPFVDKFDFYVMIENEGKEVCKLLIYEGIPSTHYIEQFFFSGKFKKEEEFILKGKENEVEIHVLIKTFKVITINLTRYEKAPSFEMNRFGISKTDKQRAYEDWLHSLPPATAAVIRKSHN
jgi:hypothetical protein